MKIELQTVPLPEFGAEDERPHIPDAVYLHRCTEAYGNADVDWLVVYGDREHAANLTYLCGFDPRFEEALLLLGPHDHRVLVVGNEGLGYTGTARVPVDVSLAQSLSLMGQDRSQTPRLSEILMDAGIGSGQRIGVAGWKYLEPDEADTPAQLMFAPSVLVDTLRSLAGDPQAVRDATAVLMHPTRGLRARNEAVQIAAFEWEATRATESVWRIVRGTRPGMSEMEAVTAMRYAGDPLSCHAMFASGGGPIVGLRSPSPRRLESGEGVTTAVGFWGGLCCRAGLLSDGNGQFLEAMAIPYFRAVVTWYESMRIDAEGGAVFETVRAMLAEGKLRSLLNPGHLTSYDEWLHTPVRPGSTDRILSGMAFQCDIISTPMPDGWAMNCEDPMVIADTDLRAELRRDFPALWSRIETRQAFMRDRLGIEIGDELLPLSSIPAYLPPLWLASDRVLTRG